MWGALVSKSEYHIYHWFHYKGVTFFASVSSPINKIGIVDILLLGTDNLCPVVSDYKMQHQAGFTEQIRLPFGWYLLSASPTFPIPHSTSLWAAAPIYNWGATGDLKFWVPPDSTGHCYSQVSPAPRRLKAVFPWGSLVQGLLWLWKDGKSNATEWKLTISQSYSYILAPQKEGKDFYW